MPNDKIAFNFPDLNVPKNLTDSVPVVDDNANYENSIDATPDNVILIYHGKRPGHYFADVNHGIVIIAGSWSELCEKLHLLCQNEPQPWPPTQTELK